MMSSQIAGGEPFDASRTAQIPEHFRRDGFCRIPGVLAADEVATLQEQTGRLMAAPGVVAGGHVQRCFRYVRCVPHAKQGRRGVSYHR